MSQPLEPTGKRFGRALPALFAPDAKMAEGTKLEAAQRMANHESARTTGLHDRSNDQVQIVEVERILNFGASRCPLFLMS